MRVPSLLRAGLLAAGACLAAAVPITGSKWSQQGPTTAAKGEFSWFVTQTHGDRIPADSNGDVSKDFMVFTTNRNISMYDMKGNRVAPSIKQGGPDGFFLPNCRTPGSQSGNEPWLQDELNLGGDARVLYDASVKRWYISAFATIRNAGALSGADISRLVLAVSTSANPTKPWRVLIVQSYPFDNKWWGDFPMIGYSRDKIVLTMNYFPVNPALTVATDNELGIFVLDKKEAVKGQWSFQYIVPPVNAPQGFLLNQTGFAANPAVDVDAKRRDAFLVSSSTNDPFQDLRISTLRGLPPNVQFSVQVVNVTRWDGPVIIQQGGGFVPLPAGDARVASAPVLRATRVKGQVRSQLRLYASYGVGNPAQTLNGIRVDIVNVGKATKPPAAPSPLTLEGSFEVFTSTNQQRTYPSIAVNKAGVIGLGSSVGTGMGLGAGLMSVNPVSGALTCVPDFPGNRINFSRWGDYSSTRSNPYCEGTAKGAGFCAFQMRGIGPPRAWDLMGGCYCPKAFSGCPDQPTFRVVGGSFGPTKNVPVVNVPKTFNWDF